MESNYNKLKKIFKDIEPDKLSVCEKLIQNVSFMELTLDRLQKEIDSQSIIEHFEQGKQKFLRENPALKSYNTTFKNYQSAIKQLVELLPEKSKEVEGESILKFVAK